MWKWLPLLLLGACAGQQASQDTAPSEEARIVRSDEIPLQPVVTDDPTVPTSLAFRRGETQGELRSNGSWQVNTAVIHGRLFCATYEAGIQFGAGDPSCTDVQWLTQVEFGSRQTHCNNAKRFHTAEGTFSSLQGNLDVLTCARVVIRCDGSCGR